MRLAYSGFDSAGAAASGTLDASDAHEAAEMLRRQGIYATDVKSADQAATGNGGNAKGSKGRGKHLKNLAMFTRQLSVLVSSGTPLVQSLAALERQTKDPHWRSIIATIRGKVEEGIPLSRAMESYPQTFDAICRSLIAAGESSGSFDTMLERLALLTKKQLQVRGAVIGALVYPSLLILISFGVLALMLLFVLPRFAGLFDTLGVALPPTTQMLMTLSGWLRGYWWTPPAVGAGVYFACRRWMLSGVNRRLVDNVLLRLPIVGGMFRSFSLARIARILGVLLVGKVPLLEALSLTRQTVRNLLYVELMTKAEDAVVRGANISGVFASTDLVNPSLCEAIRSGEESGQIGPLLINIADFLDEENEVIVKSLTSILEPIILIFLGLIVGFVALSMFLPLFDLTSATHAG